jgi:chorismate mutase
MRSFYSLLIIIGVGGCQTAAPTAPAPDLALDSILQKINERLALMESVAAYKRQQQKPVEDPTREAALLRDVEAKAASYQLSPKNVNSFFRAQIEAAKVVQENHLRRWSEEHRKPDAPSDLNRLRQQIDRLNDELLAALTEWRKLPRDRTSIEKRAKELILGEGIDDKARSVAIQPLLEQD